MNHEKLSALYGALIDSVARVYPDAVRQAAPPPEDSGGLCKAAEYLSDQMCGALTGDASALGSLFNHLNRNQQNDVYPMKPADELVLPQRTAGTDDSAALLQKALRRAEQIPQTDDDFNALLDRMEKYTAFLPDKREKELSLFDTAKLQIACVSVLYDCIAAGILEQSDLKQPESIMDRELFLLFSYDTSGIQNFIYTIASKGALKGLRARSFYLEMVMEVIVDELLRRAELSHANLIYTGGGHAYVLLPNTPEISEMLETFTKSLRDWFRDTFKTALYVAPGSCACTASQLANNPAGSYREIFRTVSARISERKLHRFTAAEIMELNKPQTEHSRECRICHRSDRLTKEDLCTVCASLLAISSDLQTKQFFVLHSGQPANQSTLAMPFGYYLTAESENTLKGIANPVRIFSKNQIAAFDFHALRLWLGDYASDQSFTELADREDEGIRRLAVLRADVDNLGQAFISGFDAEYMSLPRASAFSRSLSVFFKYHINGILQNGRYHLNGSTQCRPRKAAVVYAGGDDVFVVGAWDDIIGFAVDLHETLTAYSQDTLHISGGIGIYDDHYPIAAMARESGVLEEIAKHRDGKNALTLFHAEGCYSWDDLIEKVLTEKLGLLNAFFSHFGKDGASSDATKRGNSMLYKMLGLIREQWGDFSGDCSGERLNIARFAYYLARLRPAEPKNPKDRPQYEQDMVQYRDFSDKLYTWMQNKEDSRQLAAAIQLYVYLHRNPAGKEEG